MCGIAGVLDLDGVEASCVERQLRQLDHRGPDSWGVYARGCAAVGQTRLAVLDLCSGDPPITDENDAIGVALNGEIYNFASLRRELTERGHTLTTTGDTEVIAHLAEELDPVELARRLDGMFAFAVWDSRRQRLVLGRDRLGKKPLYYWEKGGRLVFASEIKALLAHPLVSRQLDPDALPAYLTFGYVPTPRTFFAGIRSVAPGHVLWMEAGGRPRLERYWRAYVPGAGGDSPLDLPLAEAAGEVRTRLTAAVKRRLVADVPLGAFLSGGVDSSAIVAIMAALGVAPLLTFTIGFEDDEGFDERPYARLVSRRFGTEHHELVVNPDAVDLVERLVWHHDQPFGDSSAVPVFLLSEMTRKHVKVALSGDGGDELFAGYQRFGAALALQRFQQLPRALRRAAVGAALLVPEGRFHGPARSIQRFLTRSERPVHQAFLAWVSYVPPERHQELVGDGANWGTSDWDSKWRATEGADLLDRLLELTLGTYLLDDLLPKADRMSMAHGLEVRSPFLDAELVEFALRLTRAARIRGLETKRVVKRAMRDVLPAEVLTRRKQGFGVPLDRWFRSDLRAYLDAMLGARQARVRVHLDGIALDRLLAEHHSGAANHRDTLWTLLTLEVFLRREGW